MDLDALEMSLRLRLATVDVGWRWVFRGAPVEGGDL